MTDTIPEWFRAAHGALARRSEDPDRENPADPETVWAMPLVCHLEKDRPPRDAAVLAAAAASAPALCLDERSAPGGPWNESLRQWLGVRIRKIARRARGAKWDAATEEMRVPGVTVHVTDRAAPAGFAALADVRSVVPGPVHRVPRPVACLQIGGTELSNDGSLDESLPAGWAAAGSAEDPCPWPVVWINPDLDMSLGKLAAQVAHGAQLAAGDMPVEAAWAWAHRGCRCLVRRATFDRWRELLALVEGSRDDADAAGVSAVCDAGYTEVEPGSLTVIAQWNSSSRRDS